MIIFLLFGIIGALRIGQLPIPQAHPLVPAVIIQGTQNPEIPDSGFRVKLGSAGASVVNRTSFFLSMNASSESLPIALPGKIVPVTSNNCYPHCEMSVPVVLTSPQVEADEAEITTSPVAPPSEVEQANVKENCAGCPQSLSGSRLEDPIDPKMFDFEPQVDVTKAKFAIIVDEKPHVDETFIPKMRSPTVVMNDTTQLPILQPAPLHIITPQDSTALPNPLDRFGIKAELKDRSRTEVVPNTFSSSALSK